MVVNMNQVELRNCSEIKYVSLSRLTLAFKYVSLSRLTLRLSNVSLERLTYN